MTDHAAGNTILTDAMRARRFIEKCRWPNGPVCAHCGAANMATELRGGSIRPGLYKCRACRKPFSVTIGTMLEGSKVALNKWLMAVKLLRDSGAAVTTKELGRHIGVSYKTAWQMRHKIMHAGPGGLACMIGDQPPPATDGRERSGGRNELNGFVPFAGSAR
jgi:transposase-like protein